jgi:hypothetical protein
MEIHFVSISPTLYTLLKGTHTQIQFWVLEVFIAYLHTRRPPFLVLFLYVERL